MNAGPTELARVSPGAPVADTGTSALERHLEVASLSGEVRAVMTGIVDSLLELAGVDGASLSTIEGDEAYFAVCGGVDKVLEGSTLPLEETLGKECLRRGEVTLLRAKTDAGVAHCLTPGAGSIVLAPIEYDGTIRGVLGVRSADATAFDTHEVTMIDQLSRGAAIALRNAELVERLAESERRYRDLHAQAADATLVSDVDGNLSDANIAAAALLWYSVDELRGMNVRSLFVDLPNGDAAERLELAERGEVRSERALRRKDGAVLDVEYSSRLLDDGRVHTSLRDVTRRKRNEERLRSSLGRLHAIVQTQQDISALELDPDAVTATIVERTRRLAGADGVTVQWFDGFESVVRHASGVAAQHIGLRLDRAASLVGVAARTGETVYVPDTGADSRVDVDACRRLGARSLICTPLYRDGEIAGGMSVIGSVPSAFDELDVETCRLMAEFVSTVIRNSNELEERRRFAEELRMQGDVVRHMQTGLWVWVQDDAGEFRLDYANAASDAALGLASGDMLGKRLDDVLPSRRHMPTILGRVLETGKLVDLGEVEYGDARIAPSVFTMKAFPLPGRRVAVTFENVTDAARARRALQESEARFRGAFNASSLGMALTTLDGTFVQVNDRLAEMLGYSVQELTRLGVRGITHPRDIEEDMAYAEQMRSREIDSYQREKRYLCKDGSVLWAELTVSLVRGYDDTPTHVVSHVQDITAQKEANLLFEATFERSMVPKLVCDDARRVTDVNQAAVELIGIARDAVVGLSIDDLLPGESVAELWPTFMRVGTMEAEVTLHRPDGGERRIEFVATANVRPGRHIAVVRDLTRQKELEAQLRQAQKMEAVGRLAGGVAHDFNNLLTAIAGYSEFLISGLTEDDRLRRHAEEIKKASARAAALTGQLLAFSRRQVLQPRVLDLNAVVSDMDMMLRRLIGEDVELVAMLETNLATVRADPTQLEQVIVNLAVNARDAMPNGGSLTIETANVELDDDGFVELRMTDTGIGMTDTERHQLFDPFFTTKEGGTGLGLATVYGIVEQSGGTIEVDSAPGMGSSFRILLPRVDAPAEDLAAPPAGSSPESGSETVLLVEDETVVRQLVAEILEMNGYTVLQAGDGPSALELLRRHSGTIELLVTDVVMPGMSGPEVAQAVTSMRPGTQVLYTSGYTDSAIGHHGVLEPDVAFLQKPFSADDLTRKVRGLLDGPVAVD
jgi:two-component system, cell cycle sensor histidine kinase and response regulator CckA